MFLADCMELATGDSEVADSLGLLTQNYFLIPDSRASGGVFHFIPDIQWRSQDFG